MTEDETQARESLKDLALGANEDEIFGALGDQAIERQDTESAAPIGPEEPPMAPKGDGPSAAATADAAELLREVEPLFAQGDWQQVCELLGPAGQAEELPAELRLLYATALKELSPDDAPEANPLAIRSMAELLGVGQDSQAAVIVAKRILRRNPATWRTRAAPSASTRVVMVLATVLLGAVVGWLLGPSGINLDEVLRAAMR